MMKLISLLKAALSQDMKMFSVNAGKNSSKLKKVIIPILLFLLLCFTFGGYAYMIAEVLAPFNLTYVMLSIMLLIVTALTFWSGIYKSQGILFEARDNDLLFSLPIKKSYILFVRIFKLMLYQFIYGLMFLLPTFAIYVWYEKPGISFYILSFFMSIFVLIIPIVISSMLGYIVKLVSSKFKSKKIMQTLFTTILLIGIFFLSYNMDGYIQNLAKNAISINDMITKLYYPIGLYINLVLDFNILDLIKFIVINILPFVLFVAIGSKYYFKIISKSKENSISKKIDSKKKFIKHNTPLKSLIKKEIKRFFSSPVYMLNSAFGLFLVIFATIFLPTNIDEINTLLATEGLNLNLSISTLFYFLILFVGSITMISASSISLEGKTINITKSLPISEKLILKSKIVTCYLIELPFFIVANIIFVIRFSPSIIEIALLLLGSLVIIFLIACWGLITNLKYPKLDANSDTEVVKQSMSSMIATFSGIILSLISVASIIYLSNYILPQLAVALHLVLIAIISVILYTHLMKYGIKLYKKLNV